MGIDFGESLKKWRELQGITKTTLGRKIGVSRHTVYLYELGNRTPGLGTIRKLKELTGNYWEELAPHLERPDKYRSEIVKEMNRSGKSVEEIASALECSERSVVYHLKARASQTNPPNDNQFGEALKAWREKQKLTKKAMAERLGITMHTLLRFEKGYRIPHMASQAKLRRVIGEEWEEIAKLLPGGADRRKYRYEIARDMVRSGKTVRETAIALGLSEKTIQEYSGRKWEKRMMSLGQIKGREPESHAPGE